MKESLSLVILILSLMIKFNSMNFNNLSFHLILHAIFYKMNYFEVKMHLSAAIFIDYLAIY
jgi:hypothetical protein